jgi:hypothetical protein
MVDNANTVNAGLRPPDAGMSHYYLKHVTATEELMLARAPTVHRYVSIIFCYDMIAKSLYR